MTKEQLIEKLERMMKDEEEAYNEYKELIFQIREYLSTEYMCFPETVTQILMKIARIPHDEFQHRVLLEQVKCIMEMV